MEWTFSGHFQRKYFKECLLKPENMIPGPSLETIYLREKLHGLKDIFNYLPAPRDNGYLIRRQRGELEGLAESYSRLNPAQNTTYGSTGRYDIASILGLYNPATSFSADLYSPKRNSYQKERDQYSV